MEQIAKKKGANQLKLPANPLIFMVLQAGLEPAAPGLGILSSIHLSYWSKWRCEDMGACAFDASAPLAAVPAVPAVECGPEGMQAEKNTRKPVSLQAIPARDDNSGEQQLFPGKRSVRPIRHRPGRPGR